jgi:hypothetical protein
MPSNSFRTKTSLQNVTDSTAIALRFVVSEAALDVAACGQERATAETSTYN